jgi:hypothetical protein
MDSDNISIVRPLYQICLNEIKKNLDKFGDLQNKIPSNVLEDIHNHRKFSNNLVFLKQIPGLVNYLTLNDGTLNNLRVIYSKVGNSIRVCINHRSDLLILRNGILKFGIIPRIFRPSECKSFLISIKNRITTYLTVVDITINGEINVYRNTNKAPFKFRDLVSIFSVSFSYT